MHVHLHNAWKQLLQSLTTKPKQLQHTITQSLLAECTRIQLTQTRIPIPPLRPPTPDQQTEHHTQQTTQPTHTPRVCTHNRCLFQQRQGHPQMPATLYSHTCLKCKAMENAISIAGHIETTLRNNQAIRETLANNLHTTT